MNISKALLAVLSLAVAATAQAQGRQCADSEVDLHRPVYLEPGSLVCGAADELYIAELSGEKRDLLTRMGKCATAEARIRVNAVTYTSPREYGGVAVQAGIVRVIFPGGMSDARVYSAWTCGGNLRN